MENLLDKIKIEIDNANNDENHQINSNIKVDLTLSDLNEIYCLIKDYNHYLIGYVKCIDNKCTTNGLTINKIYKVIGFDELGNSLIKIKDDNGDIKGYDINFFTYKL